MVPSLCSNQARKVHTEIVKLLELSELCENVSEESPLLVATVSRLHLFQTLFLILDGGGKHLWFLPDLCVVLRGQEMSSEATSQSREGEMQTGTWRNSPLKYRFKWQEPGPTLLPSLLSSRRNDETRLSHRVTKQQFLYCSIGIGFHLQILPNGRVNGAHESNHYGIMELLSVKIGIVAIRAVVTRMFLAITRQGMLYGSENFTEDCLFKEQMEENHYTTYSSHTHPRLYVALTKRGEPKNGSKARLHHPSTHFIPRSVSAS
ncbi:fibroblast growth factor 20-like [Stegostoma tigrinum]|uniref:fibroblast growth factor 20-like n=1 Tax=Stegostoma tigrinum TaxID=3053191 RepID=UPI00286FE843|nr:fibroblast growth factor 20-like [Stegostoma tigrinum]